MARETAASPREFTASPARRRRGGRLTWILAGLLMTGVVLFFVPHLVAISPVKDWLLARALASQPIRVQVGALQAGWFTPLVARQVVVTDEQGGQLAAIEGALTEKSLFALLSDWRELGRIRLEQPHLLVRLRADGSNVEDLLAKFQQQPSSGSEGVSCVVEVVDGVVDCEDLVTQRTLRVEQLQALLNLPRAPHAPHGVKLELSLATNAPTAAKLRAEAEWQAEQDAQTGAFGRGAVRAHSERMPLDVLEALGRRLVPGLALQGELIGDAQYEWSEGGLVQKIGLRQLAASELQVSAPGWLSEDSLRASHVQCDGDLTLQDGTCHVQAVALDAPFAKIRASGAVPLHWERADALTWLRRLDRDLDIRGEIDVAQLTQLLPATLRLREGTRVEEGLVGFQLLTKESAGRRVWDGRLETSRLSADASGQSLRWDKPITVALSAMDSATGLIVERLACKSSFLDVEARGAPEKGTLTAKGNLDQMVADLGRLIDLQPWKLAGALEAELGWEILANRQLSASGKAEVRQFEFSGPQTAGWREAHLTLTADASGLRGEDGRLTVQQGTARLESGADRLEARLLEPVSPPSLQSPWHLECKLSGDLASWLPRLQPWLSLPGWELAGKTEVDAQVSLIGDRIEVPQGKVLVQQFVADGGGLHIREPRLQLDVEGVWKGAQRELTAPNVVLASSTVAARGEEILLRLAEGGCLVTGDAGFRADLTRLASWLADPQTPVATRLSGMTVGQVHLAYDKGIVQTVFTADTEKFLFATRDPASSADAPRWQPAWEEPKLTVTAKGDYALEQATLTLEEAEVSSKALRALARGSIGDPAGRCELDLTGNLSYDWKQMSAVLRPYVGSLLQIEGQESREFMVRGPLFQASPAVGAARPVSRSGQSPAVAPRVPEELQVASRIGWTAARYSGFEFGPADVEARLQHGTVTMGPASVPLSGGKLNLAPTLQLNQQPMVLSAEPGVIADQVRISPEMCQGWLKYVAPLLSDATAAEGKFSVNLEQAQLPLDNPVAGTARGTLVVHEATIGPGPLSRELVWLANQVKAVMEKRPLNTLASPTQEWIRMPEQSIEFELAEQRVHHRGIAFRIKDVDIRTRGYVGIDQQLALIAEVPVKDEWVAKDRVLSSLKGQVLQVPIAGSLSQPKLDVRAVAELSKQAVTGAATKFIEGEIGRGLDKLLRPR